MMARTVRLEVPARIVIVGPPAGVAFALQRGKRELASVHVSTGADLHLDFAIQVARALGSSLRFSGDYVQGPAGGKFVYVNSGTLAGQAMSCWTRRAKVSLQKLTGALVQRAVSNPGFLLEARISGIARDGGPACASVPLLDRGWIVKPTAEASR
jgi:hypothetical protein